MTTVTPTKFKETEIGLIPEEWEVSSLGQSVDIIDGDRGANYPNGDDFSTGGYCLFLNTKNVSGDIFNFSNLQFITREKDEMLRMGKLKRGDFVLTTRGTVGNIAFYDNGVTFEHIRINSGMVILRNNEYSDNFDPLYLYQLLKSKFVRDQFLELTTGSAQPQLPIRDLKKLKLIKPPIDEQKQIAEILSSLDDKIELNRKINSNLEKIASALFKKWFVDDIDPNNLPEGWRKTTLGEFVPIKTGKKDANVATTDGNYAFFTCSQEILKTDQYSFDASALLLAGNGDFNIKWYEGKFEAYQRTYVLIPHQKELLGFLYYLIKYFLDDITAGHRGSVIRFITKGMIENFEIKIPGDKDLEKMANIFYQINQSVDFYKRELENLVQIRDSLLPRLMSGKIRVKQNG